MMDAYTPFTVYFIVTVSIAVMFFAVVMGIYQHFPSTKILSPYPEIAMVVLGIYFGFREGAAQIKMRGLGFNPVKKVMTGLGKFKWKKKRLRKKIEKNHYNPEKHKIYTDKLINVLTEEKEFLVYSRELLNKELGSKWAWVRKNEGLDITLYVAEMDNEKMLAELKGETV